MRARWGIVARRPSVDWTTRMLCKWDQKRQARPVQGYEAGWGVYGSGRAGGLVGSLKNSATAAGRRARGCHLSGNPAALARTLLVAGRRRALASGAGAGHPPNHPNRPRGARQNCPFGVPLPRSLSWQPGGIPCYSYLPVSIRNHPSSIYICVKHNRRSAPCHYIYVNILPDWQVWEAL